MKEDLLHAVREALTYEKDYDYENYNDSLFKERQSARDNFVTVLLIKLRDNDVLTTDEIKSFYTEAVK